MKNNWKEEFRQAFGIYWSKQGDNAYIADPINNTRPIILSQEAVEAYIESLLAEQKKELLDLMEKEVENRAKLFIGSDNLDNISRIPEPFRSHVQGILEASTIANNLRV